MSAIMLGLAFKAPMGTVNRKAVLLKLADHAHDDGTNIYPSVARIADETHLSTRTVQRVLADFVTEDLLHLVDNEDGGRGRPRNYMLNVPMLQALALGEKGDRQSSFQKGDRQNPNPVKRVTPATKRVTGATQKGDKLCHPNHQEPSEPSSDHSDDLFLGFWAAYPRRENRRQAEVEFRHAETLVKDPAIIVAGAKAYAAKVAKLGRETKYIKLASNWLADRLWEDENTAAWDDKASNLRTITANDPEWNKLLEEYEAVLGRKCFARQHGSWAVPKDYQPGAGEFRRVDGGGIRWFRHEEVAA
jgi:hypothetical protein